MAANKGESETGAMSSSLTGLQKAAALLTALGEQTSALVVKHLSEEEVEKVSQAIAQMQPLRTDEAESVIHEFNDLLLAQQKDSEGRPGLHPKHAVHGVRGGSSPSRVGSGADRSCAGK